MAIENNKEMTEIALQKTILKPNQEKFCILYMQTGIATTSYCDAYGIDKKDLMQYMSAAAMSSKLLKNVKICARLNELMTLAGFTDEGVDRQLNFLIQQHDDKKTKLSAIKEYNNLKKRTGAKTLFTGNTFNMGSLLDKANAIEGEIV